jgi:O-antigen/teichoic acid export membrane protein
VIPGLPGRVFRNDIIRHGALIFASTTLVNLCNYGFHLLISRRLGVTGYGALSSLLAALMLATIPATIATSTIAKYASTLGALRDTGGLRTFTGQVVRYATLIAGVSCVLGLLARDWLASYLNLPDSRPVALLTVIASVQFVFLAIRGILQGVQDFRRFAIATASEVSGKLMLGVGLVYAGFGVSGALLGYAIASALSLAYALAAVHVHLGAKPGPLFLDVGRLLRTTGGIAVSTASLASLGFADVVLVKHFFDPHVAGLYGAISLVGKTLLFVVSFVPTIVLPKAAARAARGESPLSLLVQAGALTVCFAVAGLGFIYLFPARTINLMVGPAFTAAAPYVLPYGCAMALLGATTIVASYKIGLHQFNFLAPLVAVAVGEIVALQFLHEMLSQVISVVLIAQAIAFVGALYRITAVEANRAEGAASVRIDPVPDSVSSRTA